MDNNTPASYEDPFRDASSEVGRRLTEMTSLLLASAQLVANYRRQRQLRQAIGDEHKARWLHDQRQAAIAETRRQWAPAFDPEWLGHADLLETARVWSAAMPYGHEAGEAARDAQRLAEWARQESAKGPQAAARARQAAAQAEDGARLTAEAAQAMDKCEARLRDLHPHAMAHYDRLRAEGLSAPEAMGHAAPFFARRPNVHDAWAAPDRAALEPGAQDTPAWAATTPGPSGGQDDAWRMEQRCRRIIEQLQAQARAAGRNELGDAELRTVLEHLTNAPERIIAASVERDRKRRVAAGLTSLVTDDRTDYRRTAKTVSAEARKAAAGHPARASALDFPHDVRETVTSAARGGIEPSDPAQRRRRAPDTTRRRGRR